MYLFINPMDNGQFGKFQLSFVNCQLSSSFYCSVKKAAVIKG